MSTVVSCIVPSITSAQKVRSNFSGKNGKEAAAAQKCTEEKCTEEVGRALPALRFKEPRCHLGGAAIFWSEARRFNCGSLRGNRPDEWLLRVRVLPAIIP